MGNVNHSLYHESVYMDNGIEVGNGTRIWHFSHIIKGAVIGEDCIIGQNCFIAGKIGNRCKIQNNAQVFDGVIIEDDVFVGPSVTFCNVLLPRAFIEQKQNFQTTIIKQGVTIGAGVTIRCGITVGEYAFIGAGSVVTRSVKPYAMVYGNPAQTAGWVCKNGHRKTRRAEVCKICGDKNEDYD